MAQVNEQDPITGRKLPRLVNYNGQDPITPKSTILPKLGNYSRSTNLKPSEIGGTGDIQLVDYTQSGYDNPGGTFVEDLPNLNSIRAENQGFLDTLGNGLGRAAFNVIPTVIGNFASILDFEDYVNQDNEVGNAITRAMEEVKTNTNEELFPIFQQNPNENLNLGDSAWWIQNGSMLAESIGAFAITGAALGAGFNALGKGLGTINGLSQLGQAGKTAATILSATGLNQAESITTAMQVYDSTYKAAIQNGQDDAKARQNAADAASYSININRANIALNLTSAGAFIRSPLATRQIREAFGTNLRRELLHEGAQEYAEETLNYIAQKEGERFGQAKATGKEYKYNFQNSINDALSAEGFESGLLGFLGGVGQTALTGAYKRLNGEAARENQLAQSQLESINRIKGLQDAGIVPNATNVFNSMEKNLKLQDDINDAVVKGDDGEVRRLKYQLLNNQIGDALENGTVDQLESVYDKINNYTTDEAAAKGLETNVNSLYNYKKKAQEALDLIKDAEAGYLDVANKGYINPDEVLDTYIQDRVLNRQLIEQKKVYNDAHTKALEDKYNLDITADLDATKPPKELTDLRSYKEYVNEKQLLENLQKRVITNNDKYNTITSDEYQANELAKRQSKLQEELVKAEEKVRAEDNKQVKKRQKEVKKKVDNAKNATAETVPFEDVPLPTESDVTDITDENTFTEEPIEESDVTDIPNDPIADLEARREEELVVDGRMVYEQGVDRQGNEWDSWITHRDAVNAKYDAELAELQGPASSENVPVEPEVTDVSYITPEEKITADIVTQEEVNEEVKETNKSELVKSPQDIVKTNNDIKINNMTRQRDVANTIISLNVNYIELSTAGEDGIKTISITDQYDNDGNLIINENFDSRLQSPNQFSKDDIVNIIVPTYQEMLANGLDNYSESDYNNNQKLESFPIAFTDNTGKIIGYLPTQENVYKRVNPDYRNIEMIKNGRLREVIFNNRDKKYTVKITRKSPGTLLTNNTSKSLYSALGDGSKLANDVSIAVYKDSRLQTSLGASSNVSLINRTDLQAGYIYSILPTADKNNYIAAPMEISRISQDNARSILKVLQLFKANPASSVDNSLVQERNELAREVDLSNPIQFNEVLDSMIYRSSIDGDYNMFKMTPSKLILGVTKDMSFTWDAVMRDPQAQSKIIDILTKRYNAVQLSKFGQRFNQYKVNSNNQLEQIRHNNYFDYLNNEGVIRTNVQGFPVTGEVNQMYFTGQSVIEFSDPIVDNTIEQAPIKEAVGVKEVTSTKPKNKLGIKYKPKNTPSIEEDFDFISNLENKSIDQQAEDLMKKCGG